jgi:hypothetical protein
LRRKSKKVLGNNELVKSAIEAGKSQEEELRRKFPEYEGLRYKYLRILGPIAMMLPLHVLIAMEKCGFYQDPEVVERIQKVA